MSSIFTTLIKYIRDLPLRTTPLDSDMIPCAGVDGSTYHTTRGALRTDLTLPAGHAASHKHGGLDEVATATPASNAIPKANGSGKLDGWISGATTSSPGLVELATDGEASSGVAVQGNDARLGKITPGVPQTLGNTYIDLQEVAANSFADPASEHKRLFLDLESGLLSVKGTSGLAIPLEPAITVSPTGEGDAIVNRLSTDDTTGIGLVRVSDTGVIYGIEATESSLGVVELATDGETASGVAVQGNDSRLVKSFRVLPTEGSEQVAHKLEVNDNQGLNLTWIQNLPTDNIAFINIATASESGVGVVQLAPDADNTPGLAVQADDSRLGNITPDTPQTLGAAYLDIGEVDISAVPNPAAGHRRLYVDDSTHQLTAKKPDGSIADLENQVGSIQVVLTAGGTSTAETLQPGTGIVTTDEGDLVTEISLGPHNHAASDITTGTIATARLGSGTANSTTFLRGDSTYAAPPSPADATTSTKGIVELATNGESASGVVVQGNDERLLKIIRKSTLTSVSGSSAVTADPELTRSVVAGSTYYFRLVIHVDDVGATGITYSLDGTATYSHIRYQTYAVGNVSWGLLNADRVTGIGITSQAVGDTFYCVYIDGSCVVTGSGTMEFNWGPSSVVIDDVSVLEGSTFELTLAMA